MVTGAAVGTARALEVGLEEVGVALGSPGVNVGHAVVGLNDGRPWVTVGPAVVGSVVFVLSCVASDDPSVVPSCVPGLVSAWDGSWVPSCVGCRVGGIVVGIEVGDPNLVGGFEVVGATDVGLPATRAEAVGWGDELKLPVGAELTEGFDVGMAVGCGEGLGVGRSDGRGVG